MGRYRLPLAAALAVVLIFDVVTAFRAWWYGWPKYIWMASDGQNQRIVVESVPWTVADVAVLLLWGLIHIALVYAVVKAWRAGRIHV